MIEGIFCLFAFWREGIIVIQLLNMARSRCSEKYTGWLKSGNYYGTKLGLEHQYSDSRPGPWSTMYHIISRGMSLKYWPKQKRAVGFLVAQWLRICLPMQRTRVRALVWEDPTCRGAAGPVSHNYWACASGACAPQQEKPQWWEARAPRWRVVPTCRN